jgi:mRNA interferase HicA
VYFQGMKYRDVVKKLGEYKWWFLREGGNHEIWTNGTMSQSVPRHKEIREFTAKGIIKKAEENPGMEE